ncbi:MAG TPA: hypothetical protein PKJ15_05325, partial [Methanomassiliicoccales archaeon]|nr:hypothetical protein [Methanomassiliicoccales archaeon]
MNNESQYIERLPKYVFKGSANNRRPIVIIQLLTRLFAILIILSMVYLFLFRKTLGSSPIDFVGLAFATVAVIILLHDSEIVRQKELDGNVAIAINGETLSSREPYHRIVNRRLSMKRDDIDYVEIIRGDG